jgi:ABC-type polysaccharide/polyol phosphate transport system ATPase subunit
MAELALRVDNLSKCYRIARNRPRARYQTLQEDVIGFARGLVSRTKRPQSDETFWALNGITFDVNAGEVLGIIGHNGAGKSTLLKILSRITDPTQGRAEVYGRVGSLLEVGTGFHPELTGRENIYLNGAILGMRRHEITKHFDEIVEFAEVEQFLDTPVKRYSSGMYMRLAFAVAAHLEPEVLLIDEVLAVGDEAFQKKCLGKMGEVATAGRTVFFVSHNLEAVSTLTKRTLLIDHGKLAFDGDTMSALSLYRSKHRSNSDGDYVGPNLFGVTRVRVITSEPGGIHRFGKPLIVEFDATFKEEPKKGALSFQILDEQGRPIVYLLTTDSDQKWTRPGKATIRCEIPRSRLYMGRYTITVHLADRSSYEKLDTVRDVCPFEVVMDGIPCEYPWVPGTCTYLEDASWIAA